jgi:hypothetical protein
MNQFRKRDDGTLVTEQFIRANFDGGLPAVLDIDTLASLGYDPVLHSPQLVPAFGQYVIQDGVEQHEDNNWYYKWAVMDYPPEVVEQQKADLQKILWEAIKAERDARKAGGLKLTIAGTDYWFWTDDPSRAQYAMLTDMIRRNNLPDTQVLDQWKTMDGTFVSFTVAMLHNVIDAGIAAESALFHVAETKRQEMLAASNPSEYVWNTGWPQTYAEYEMAKNQAAAEVPPTE